MKQGRPPRSAQGRLAQWGEALKQAVHRLRSEGVDSPRLDAELLLAHALDTHRAAILTWPERQLTPKELTTFRNLVERRAAREPLAYIVGHREFFGLEFLVDPRVLIPRPETELLVEHSLHVARDRPPPILIADVGTGCGAIAVTLAFHLPEAIVYALDVSAAALAVTADNARRHGVKDRVHCLLSESRHPLAPLPKPVDLITANLPYVSTDEWETLAPEIREYEPRAALDGGPDGLDAIRCLLSDAASPHRDETAEPPSGRSEELLSRGAVVLLEIGAGQGDAVLALARRRFGRATVKVLQDYAGLDRVVAIEPSGGPD